MESFHGDELTGVGFKPNIFRNLLLNNKASANLVVVDELKIIESDTDASNPFLTQCGATNGI